MPLLCIPVPRLVSCTLSTIPIIPFKFFHLLVAISYNLGIIVHSYTSKFCELKGGNVGIVDKIWYVSEV